jgi:hypothetical protein
METIVFKEFAARPDTSDRANFTSKRLVAATGRPIISAAAFACLASVVLVATVLGSKSVEAKPSGAGCWKKHSACIARCKRVFETPSRVEACYKRCDVKVVSCIPNEGSSNAETPPDPLKPKGGDVRTPSTGSAKDEPKAPPKVNDTRAPTGGAKDQPKSPPKVNDTRAPIGGGVFHPKTSGAGSSGTILMSGEKPAPGAGVPKSGNGRR